MCFFFQAEDGIRDLVRSRGLGDVYKRQAPTLTIVVKDGVTGVDWGGSDGQVKTMSSLEIAAVSYTHLTLPTIYSV